METPGQFLAEINTPNLLPPPESEIWLSWALEFTPLAKCHGASWNRSFAAASGTVYFSPEAVIGHSQRTDCVITSSMFWSAMTKSNLNFFSAVPVAAWSLVSSNGEDLLGLHRGHFLTLQQYLA